MEKPVDYTELAIWADVYALNLDYLACRYAAERGDAERDGREFPDEAEWAAAEVPKLAERR